MMTFGGHAACLYNAEAAKTKVWKSDPRVIGALLGAFIAVPQQGYADVAPRMFTPMVAGAKPRVPAPVWASPQLADLSQQPVFDAPTIAPRAPGDVPAAQYQFGTHAAALYNAEIQKTQIWESAVAVRSGKLGQFFTAGVAQLTDFTLQPFFDIPQLNPLGWLFTVVCAGPDRTEYPTIQATFIRASIPGLATGILGAYVKAPAQPDLTLQPFFDSPQVSGAAPRIVPTFSTLEQSYANPQPLLVRPATPPGGAPLGAVATVPQQAYSDLQPRIMPAVVAGSMPRASVFFSVAQNEAIQRPSQIFAAALSAAPASTVSVYVRTLAQVDDRPNSVIWRAAFAILPTASVPGLVQAAGQIDVTRQPTFSRPLITGQGQLLALVRVPPQAFDYTLQGSFATPICAPPVITPPATVRIVLEDYERRIVLSSVYTSIIF